jgi:hypothetical protein
LRNKETKVFEEVIEPIYQDLEPAVVDLLRLLSDLDSDILTKNPQEIKVQYQINRSAMFTSRAAIRENCKALRAASHNASINSFLDKVERIFLSSEVPAGGFRMSRSIQMAGLLDLLEREETHKEALHEAIATTIKEIENGFIAASQVHAVHKLKNIRGSLKK